MAPSLRSSSPCRPLLSTRPASPRHQPPEDSQQLRALGPQFFHRIQRELPQHRLAGGTERDRDFAPIATVTPACDHVALDQPVDELHDAVVAELEPLGQRSDRGRPTAVQALELQEQEILLGLDTGRPGSLLAAPHEAPDLVTQLGQGLVVDRRSRPRLPPCGRHGQAIISPTDIKALYFFHRAPPLNGGGAWTMIGP